MRINDFLATDKVAHFGVSFAITVCVAAMTYRSEFCSVIGMTVAILVGIGKEIYDKAKGGKIEVGDLVADLLGAGLAGVSLFPFLMTIYKYQQLLGQ